MPNVSIIDLVGNILLKLYICRFASVNESKYYVFT